jgi:hypothetical protein
MTREECIKKLESLEEEYLGARKQLTVDLFDGRINDICTENYRCNEEEDLGALAYKCDTILAIMREDLVDHYIISRVKYIVEKRLKTIYDERR